MTASTPYLVVSAPNGERTDVPLITERITIGRLPEYNDIALQPDPQKLVTRQVHCIVEREGGSWWVVDNGSVNGTFVQRGSDSRIVQGRAQLTDGDQIKILGVFRDDDEPSYWCLGFIDPQKTQAVSVVHRRVCLEYNRVEARLSLVEGATRTPIKLRAQEHKLIRYMAQRNEANSGVPVLCAHDELIAAIWGEKSHHTAEDLNHLIWEIRSKIPHGDNGAKFLEAERAMGYRLRSCT